METIIRDKAGRFIVNPAGKAVQAACDTIQALLAHYKAGNKGAAIKLLNSRSLRPIVIASAVQGRQFSAEEARQYTSYPCVSDYLKPAMKSGKKWEELCRAARVDLHEGGFSSKFTEFIHIVRAAQREAMA